MKNILKKLALLCIPVVVWFVFFAAFEPNNYFGLKASATSSQPVARVRAYQQEPGTNLILGDIYGQEGYVCDTHCIRITGRLGLTDGSKDPLRVEKQLRACLPPEKSSDFCHRMVLHGRAVCTARTPHCESCTLRPLCDMGRASD